MNACIKGNMKAAQILIKAGANYKVSTESGSPLILACESGNIELMDYLRKLPESPGLNQGDQAGVTPLYVACFHHQVDMVKYLLSLNGDCDIRMQKGPNQSTVFHAVVDRDFRNICQMIIDAIKTQYPE
jgi:ankyrin repeat protein